MVLRGLPGTSHTTTTTAGDLAQQRDEDRISGDDPSIKYNLSDKKINQLLFQKYCFNIQRPLVILNESLYHIMPSK